MRTLLLSGVRYAGLIILVFWLAGWWRSQGMVAVGTTLMPVEVQDLQGRWQPLPESGQAQLLYLFAPWCTICDLTIDGINDLQQANSSIRPVALSYDSVGEVREFVGPHADPRGILLGTSALGRELKVQAFPSYLVVDGSGVVVARRSGYMPGWLLRLYLHWYGVI
ncbi:TlpA family protein disulfide reductase [Ferrimonas gelatinilytica]|uniref:Thioredoxin-like fold domain-containing protein n=1 Tax=Ferrimonas gelatinilytica TaxID=1255257 RepID=A0ABP9RVN2_9GAMM